MGQLDERVNGALRDCQPVVVLTTSAVVDEIMNYGRAQTPAAAAPKSSRSTRWTSTRRAPS